MGLKSIYDNLKDQGFLSKFNSYDDFLLDFFNRTTLSKKINGLYKLLSSQNASDKIIDKAVYLEKDIIPSYVLYNPLIKDHFNFVFDLLKSEGYLSKVKDVKSFIEYIDNSKVKKKIFEFLYKLGYSTTPNPTSVTNKLIENYLKSHNKLVSNLTKIIEASSYKDIDQFFDLDKTFVITIEINNLKETFALKYYNNYLTVKFKKAANKKTVDLDQLINETTLLLKLSPKNKNALELLKSIDQEKSIRAKKQKEFDDFLNVLKSDKKRLEKQPNASYTEDLENVIFVDDKKGYFDNIRVGKIIFNGEQYPVTLPFFKNGGFIWHLEGNNYNKVHSAIQNIALRIVMSLPKGHVKLKIIDEDFGSSFQMLLGLPNSIIGEQVYYDDKEVLKLFDELKKRDSNVIFSKLKNEFPDLLSFNKTREYEFEPIEIFVINGFPKFFNDQFVDYIYNQVKKGCRTGAYFLIAYDPSNISDYIKTDNLAKLSKGLSVIPNTLSEFYSSVNTDTLQAFEFTLDNELVVPDYVVNKFGSVYNEETSVSEVQIINTNNVVDYSGNSAEGINIQIGKDEKGKPVYIDISNNSGAYHGIICGSTGSGKSVLLHQIITEGARKYSSDELRFVLLDYKNGMEFQDYRNLPHALVVGIHADFEFGHATLNYLVDEMNRRANEFKQYSTGDIIDYRLKSKKVMPRVLILIDEFQKLLEDSKSNFVTINIHDDIKGFLQNIVKQGRSYGLHLMLSTQTPSDIKWDSSILDNIAIRIGLRMSRTAEDYLFNHKTSIASNFSEAYGKAVYNDKSGVGVKSTVFNVSVVNEDKVSLLVEGVKIDAEQNKWDTVIDRTVYEGNKRVDIQLDSFDNLTWASSNAPSSDCIVGKQCSIGQANVTLNMSHENRRNIAFLGAENDAKEDIKKLIIYNFIQNSDKNSKLYWYIDNPKNVSIYKKLFNDKLGINFIEDKESFMKVIEELYTLSDNGKIENTLFVIDGIGNLNGIGYQQSSINDNNAMDSISYQAIMKTLFEKHSEKISCLLVGLEKEKTEDALSVGSKLWDDFNYVVSFKGLKNKINMSDDNWNESYKLPDELAILYNRSENTEIKFNSIRINVKT